MGEAAELGGDTPRIGHAQAYAERVTQRIAAGGAHDTLGPQLTNGGDWWASGEPTYRTYTKLHPLQPSDRVLEYGCGTLRVGAHFIRAQAAGSYMGLDVHPALISEGEALIGPLLAEKRPVLGVIGGEALARAQAFAAELVFSANVAFHVHPDEVADYFAALARVTAPGATLILNTYLAPSSVQVSSTGWARPLAAHQEGLEGLSLVAEHRRRPREMAGEAIETAILEFRRP